MRATDHCAAKRRRLPLAQNTGRLTASERDPAEPRDLRVSGPLERLTTSQRLPVGRPR